MILKIKRNKELEIIKNSLENTDKIKIEIRNENVFSNKDEYYVAINNKILKKEDGHFKLNVSNLKPKENSLEVLWKKNTGEIEKFNLVVDIQKYITFGGLRPEERPQVILDLFERIDKLENRIKELEKKGTVI